MPSTHKHIRSSTANKRPTTSIADGQIALNTNASSPGLFFKDSTGASIIKIGPVHVGSTAPNATPGAGGSSGNSTGEIWLDNSLTPVGVKIWNGSAWVNATPVGSTTVQGLLELATSAETQAGTDTDRAVTPAGLQSKVSDSTSTTSSTTIASSTAVKSAYDLANAALPKSGGTITGNLEIGTTGSLSFEGSTADAFETTIAVTDPTADRTITLPDTTGTVVTTGDTGTVTSTMIANGTIVDADINSAAAIAHSKLASLTSANVLLGNASNVATSTAVTGDVTISNTGVTAITSGAIVDADINASAAIADTKLATISTAGKVNGTALTGTIPSAVLGNSSTFVGTTSIALNRSSANQALTGISSVALPGSTSGTVTVQPTAIAGTTTITLPATTGTVVTTGDSGTVTSTMIADNTIVNGDINASAAIAGTKISPDFGSQTVQTTGIFSNALGTAAAPTVTFTGDTNTGIYSPGADQVAISTGGSGRLFVDASGNVIIGTNATFNSNTFYVNTNSGTNAAFFSNNVNTTLQIALSGGVTTLDAGFGTLALATSSSERLRITSAGLVGIGTSSPGYLLTVSGGATSLAANNYLRFGGAIFASGDGSVDNYLFSGTNAITVRNAADNASLVTIKNSGAVGIGTTSPAYKLDIFCAQNDGLQIYETSSGNNRRLRITQNAGGVFYDATYSTGLNAHAWGIGGGEVARIDSSGRLLVGTSTSVASDGKLQVRDGGIVVYHASSANGAGYDIRFATDGGATARVHGQIQLEQTAGNGGTLKFSTTADGANSPTEAVRINSGQNLMLSQSGSGIFVGTTTDGAFRIGRSSFAVSSGTLYIGNAAIQVSSDVRLKNNIEDTSLNALEAINKIKVKDFTWNDPTDTSYNNRNARGKWTGLIAQELVEVLPFVVNAPRKEEDGSIDYESQSTWTLDQSQLCPVLIKAVQQQQEIIAALEARVAALESA